MKTLYIGIEQKIYLDQAGISSGKDIKLSIAGEDGLFLKDSSDNDLKDLQLVYDPDVSKYYYTITFPETETPQYIRLYFFSEEVEINQQYFPEDAHLNKSIVDPGTEIVPYGYFKEFFINVRGKLDSFHQDQIDSYLTDTKGVKSQLLAAMSDIEQDLEMFLAPREYVEERDNYLEILSQNFWQFAVSYPPIIELVEFKFKLGNRDLVEIDKKMFTINEQMGTIEFLPYPTDDSQGAFAYMIASMAGLGVAIHTVGNYERIPNMFYVKYKAGIFTKNQDAALKESIRNAVSKRALKNVIGLTDPKQTLQSVSESKDGVSSSESYATDKLMDKWEKDEEKLIFNLRKRYGKNVNVAMLS